MTEIACYFRREDWIVYRYRLNASFENTRRLCKFLCIEYSKRSGRVRLSLLLASFPNKSTITTRIQRWLCYYNAWNSKRRLPPPTSSQACSFTRALFRSLVRSPPGKGKETVATQAIFTEHQILPSCGCKACETMVAKCELVFWGIP